MASITLLHEKERKSPQSQGSMGNSIKKEEGREMAQLAVLLLKREI